MGLCSSTSEDSVGKGTTLQVKSKEDKLEQNGQSFDGIVVRNQNGSNDYSSEGLGSASTDGNEETDRVQERLIICRICDKKWLMKVS